MFGGNFAPVGWAICEGQTLSISQNTALFNLIGTTYGGDGVNTFDLPDLRGRIPFHVGNSLVLGQAAGGETVQLISNQLPIHNHGLAANSASGTSDDPTGKVPAASGIDLYTALGNRDSAMNPAAVGLTGGSQPHGNMPPFLAVTFIIALEGIYPTT